MKGVIRTHNKCRGRKKVRRESPWKSIELLSSQL